MKCVVSCIQTTSGADIADNLQRVAPWVVQAVGQGADIIALPENVFFMRRRDEDAVAYTEANHPGVRAACAWAAEYQRWILVGSVTIAAADPQEHRCYNRSLLIGPDGYIVARYDKIHLFDVAIGDGQSYRESATVLPGRQGVCANTPWGYIGMTICYDLRFPHLYRALARAGAKILAVPSAFTQLTGEAHWHTLLRARAIENGCFVIAPAQCGEHPGGRRTYGHSLIVDPWGEVLADGGAEPGVITAEINLHDVETARARIPSLKHDRDFRLP